MLYIVTTTYLVDSAVSDIWMQWVKLVFIQELADVQSFGIGKSVFTKVISGADADGDTFSLQLYFADKANAEAFMGVGYAGLSAYMDTKFSGQYLMFQTLLEVL